MPNHLEDDQIIENAIAAEGPIPDPLAIEAPVPIFPPSSPFPAPITTFEGMPTEDRSAVFEAAGGMEIPAPPPTIPIERSAEAITDPKEFEVMAESIKAAQEVRETPTFKLKGKQVTEAELDAMIAGGKITEKTKDKIMGIETRKEGVRPKGTEPTPTPTTPSLGGFEKGITEIEQSYQAVKDAQKRGAIVGAAKAAEETAFFQERQRSAEEQEQESLEKESVRQSSLDDSLNKQQEMQEEVNSIKIDSGRLWANMGTGRKILAGIGLALSAVGGPQSATSAVNIINGAIDRDIAEQKSNLASKRAGLAAQDNLLSRMRQKFGDERLAEKATKLAYLERVSLKQQEIASKFESPAQIAKASQANAAIDIQKVKAQQDFQLGMAQLAQKAALARPAAVPGQVVDAATLGRFGKERQGNFIALGGDKFAVTAIKPSPAQRDAITAIDSSVRGVEKLADYTDSTWSKLSPTQRGEIETLRNALMGSLRLPILGPGVMTEQEVERLKATIPNPKAFLSWAGREKAKATVLINHFKDQRSQQLNALGVPMDVAAGTVGSFQPEE